MVAYLDERGIIIVTTRHSFVMKAARFRAAHHHARIGQGEVSSPRPDDRGCTPTVHDACEPPHRPRTGRCSDRHRQQRYARSLSPQYVTTEGRRLRGSKAALAEGTGAFVGRPGPHASSGEKSEDRFAHLGDGPTRHVGEDERLVVDLVDEMLGRMGDM
jgi:hypothetical protein